MNYGNPDWRAGADLPNTASSVLVSSSKYLDSAVLRDWVEMGYLRRHGLDRSDYSDNIFANRALLKLRDAQAVEALFDEERRRNPVLDRYLAEGRLSDISLDQLAACPPGTVGAIYHAEIGRGFELNVGFRHEIRTQYDFYAMRLSQNHDFDHIVSGGQYNTPGEQVPIWVTFMTPYMHFGPELAGELSVRNIITGMRQVVRAALFYPASVPWFLKAMAQGIRVGIASEPFYLYRFEEVLRMTPERARAHLGVREAVDLDTAPGHALYGEPDTHGVFARAVAEDTARGVNYQTRGLRDIPTASSRRVSSSIYLNDPRLRDWVSTAYLRRNGADIDPADEDAALAAILDDLRDPRAVEALLGAECVRNPAVQRRFGAARGAADTCPAFDLWRRDRAREGAIERDLLDAPAGELGTVRVQWARLANAFEHLQPSLAGELERETILSAMGCLLRVALHEPGRWLSMVDAVQAGLHIGWASECMLGMDLDAARAMPLAQARKALGIRIAGDHPSACAVREARQAAAA